MRKLTTILFLLFGLLSEAQTVAKVDSYGGNGDDENPDQTAIYAAWNSGARVAKLTAGKVYYFSQPFIIPGGKTLDINNAIFREHSSLPQLTGSMGYIRSGSSSATYSSPATSFACPKNETVLTLPSYIATNIVVGRITLIKGPAYSWEAGQLPGSSGTYYYGIYSVVTAKKGNQITIEHGAVKGFTATQVIQYSTTADVGLINGTIDLRGRRGGYGLHFANVKNASISHVKILGTPDTVVAMHQGIHIEGVGIKLLRDTVVGGLLRASVPSAYGLNVDGQDVQIRNCFVKDYNSQIVSGMRRFMSRTYLITGCETYRHVDSRGTSINLHGNGGGIIENNYCYAHANEGSTEWIVVRFDHTTVRGNITVHDYRTKSEEFDGYTVRITENASTDILIENNYQLVLGTLPPGKNIRGVHVSGIRWRNVVPLNNLTIKKNRFFNIKWNSTPTGANIIIDSNDIESATPNYFPAIDIITASATDFSYKIRGNKFYSSHGNTLNYSFRVSDVTAASGEVSGNKTYLTNCANSYTAVNKQYLVPNPTNVTITGNRAFTCSTTPPSIPIYQQVPVNKTKILHRGAAKKRSA